MGFFRQAEFDAVEAVAAYLTSTADPEADKPHRVV